jgi:hypothetical protein
MKDARALILDYVAMCEKFGPLNFETFIEAWKDADAIATIEVARSRKQTARRRHRRIEVPSTKSPRH